MDWLSLLDELTDWMTEMTDRTGLTNGHNWIDWLAELRDWIDQTAGITIMQ